MVDDGFKRREFLATAGGLLGVSGARAFADAGREVAPAPDGGPLQVGHSKQLFIDRRFIAASENLVLTMNPAQKLGIVLDSTKEAWEKGTGGYFRVVEEDRKSVV